MTTTATNKNRKALRKRRSKRRFVFLKQLRLDTTLSSSAKMAVWALADDRYNIDTEQCNAGFGTLGKDIGRSGRQAKRSIKEAEVAGWITIQSIGGGSKTCTNRYTLVWDKIADTTKDTTSDSDTQNEETGPRSTKDAPSNKTSPNATPAATQDGEVEDGEFTEIIEQNETEGGHTCPPSSAETVVQGGSNMSQGGHEWSRGGSYMSHEPLLNLSEEEEGGKEAATAARGFAAPPEREEQDLAFQQLCQLWQIRDEFWPDIDMAKAREAFAAVSSEFGDQIRRENPGVSFGYYMLARAQVWIDAFLTAHPGGDGPKYLKKLEVWLGAPDGKGNAVPWWQKKPTPRDNRPRGRKPDLLAIAVAGARRAS
jgi:hypothetical protein